MTCYEMTKKELGAAMASLDGLTAMVSSLSKQEQQLLEKISMSEAKRNEIERKHGQLVSEVHKLS